MNIGLIAMSGIRVQDAELLRLGLTLPGFVERSKTIASLPSLGLLTLAALTPSRDRVHYMEVPDIREMNELPDGLDLVAISSFTAQIDEAYSLARRFRDKGVPVVLGGLHVTTCPEEAAAASDAVVVGEGEPCWPEVVSDCRAGRLKPKYDGGEHRYNLEDAPIPRFDLLDISRYNRLTVQTSRGCPHRCEFCASSILLTNKYKQKPIAKVLAEIDRILEIWPRPFLEFADDNSFVHKAYWKELLPELKRRSIRWFSESDISVSQDDELLELMADSGCAQILIGLESPGPTGLQGLEMRSDWKYAKVSQYKDAIRNIQSHGISVNGCFILGLDGHTTDVFEEVARFVREVELYEVQITILTPFPGTPLLARLEKEGRLITPSDWRRCTLFDVTYEPQGMTAVELRDGFRKLATELYSDEFTSWRRNNFKKYVRTARRARATSPVKRPVRREEATTSSIPKTGAAFT
jgi:radical SAM superfamily enzyme YgiQ (UPF0313 family)